MIQEPLFLWYKNRYSCDARTVILVVQEQLLLDPSFSHPPVFICIVYRKEGVSINTDTPLIIFQVIILTIN